MLELKHICKRYGAVTALDDFSLQLENGLYGLLGENGAGKSTLIKILSCNLSADSGEVLVDGENMWDMGECYRSMVGYLPQESVGYHHMRVREFMEYMAALKGLPLRSKTVQQEITEALQQVHLETHVRKRFFELSGGMKRRLLFAQAVLGTPRILILDEPTAGLDPNERIAMRNLIAQEAMDKIVILATHIISDIECVAGQIVLMKAGRMIGCATPEEWMDRVQEYVKEFVCQPEELPEMQRRYLISNMKQRQDGIHLRVVADSFEEDGRLQDAIASLDEVYLYFC